jgi:serine/threonine protein kinase
MALSFRKTKLPAIPNYEVEEKIGQGGAGVVYRGRQLTSGQKVAIKVIPARAVEDPALVRRFEQEFRAAGKLTHPNIVQVLDFGRDQNNTYLVMEFVDGVSLGQWIKRDGHLPEEVAVRFITQAAQALQYAHEHGLIHRDVKPDNLLLREDGQVKLADFGLVKDLLFDSGLTDPLSILGTPQFMAPEQCQNPKAVDARADLYSLAATLYMAVTGALPFGSCRSYLAIMEKVLRGAFTPPRDLVPSLSPEVDAAIRRAMNPDPIKRPASCLEFARALKPRRRREITPKPGTLNGVGSQTNERRVYLRYSSGMGTFCVVHTSVHAEADMAQDTWPATIEDVSRRGLALVLARRLERETVLTLELTVPGQKSPTSLLACVKRVQAQGFGHWLIGCEFPELLSDEQMQALLRPV